MAFDWRKTLGAIAPLAGTMIGGPFGAIAGKALGSIFGHPEDGDVPTPSEMAEYIEKATPEQIVELKKLDGKLRIKMKELEIKEDQLSYDDTADARAMNVANKSKYPPILTTILLVGFFASLAGLMFIQIPKANEAVIYVMVGTLGTMAIAAVQFWVGTTKGSSDKNNMLHAKSKT